MKQKEGNHDSQPHQLGNSGYGERGLNKKGSNSMPER